MEYETLDQWRDEFFRLQECRKAFETAELSNAYNSGQGSFLKVRTFLEAGRPEGEVIDETTKPVRPASLDTLAGSSCPRTLGRQTMSNWVVKCSADWLEPICDALHEMLCKQRILHADETTLQVLDERARRRRT
jgi:hypothetical protein